MKKDSGAIEGMFECKGIQREETHGDGIDISTSIGAVVFISGSVLYLLRKRRRNGVIETIDKEGSYNDGGPDDPAE